MTSLSTPPPVRHGSCRLLISINEQLYQVRRQKAITRHGRVWTISKPDGTIYTVSHYDHITCCSCPDHQYRSATCKHIMALRASGLLPRRVIKKGAPRA